MVKSLVTEFASCVTLAHRALQLKALKIISKLCNSISLSVKWDDNSTLSQRVIARTKSHNA